MQMAMKYNKNTIIKVYLVTLIMMQYMTYNNGRYITSLSLNKRIHN